MGKPHCQRCKKIKPLSEMKQVNKYSYRCRQCNTIMCKEFRTTAAGKLAIKKAVRKYNSANKLRMKAWYKAKSIDKLPCEVCGDINVHRHHPDPTKPLEVVFLCPLHHKEAHVV